jgi:hypothetical protein
MTDRERVNAVLSKLELEKGYFARGRGGVVRTVGGTPSLMGSPIRLCSGMNRMMKSRSMNMMY